MSGLLRSQSMTYVRLVMFEESANETMRTLGKDFGKLHVEDHGHIEGSHYKTYKLKTVAINNWEKKLEAFESVMKQEGVPAPGPEVECNPHFRPDGELLEALQTYLDPIEEDLGIHMSFKRQQTTLINEQIERIEVLKMCRSMALRGQGGSSGEPAYNGGYGSFEDEEKGPGIRLTVPLLSDEGDSAATFAQTISGAISASKQTLFERMIFRVSRGNAIMSFRDMEQPVKDPQTGEEVNKVVFNIIAIKAAQMQRRIMKICNFFGANIYTIPTSSADFDRQINEALRKLREHNIVLGKTSERIHSVLSALAYAPDGSSPIVNWAAVLHQERAVADAMKKTFLLAGNGTSGQSQQTVVALGWVPSESYNELRSVVEGVNTRRNSPQAVYTVAAPGSPPTYFKTNKFTGPFQLIVDTYGIARYQEVNPGLFTIITFPFLYGVMYGDMLHGSLLLLFALYLLWNEKKFEWLEKTGQLGEMFGAAFMGRYVLLFMSLFAVYCGTVYNDCASIPVNAFGSRWDMTTLDKGGFPYPTQTENWPYPYGVDPEWMGKKNELIFLNSLKMKMSVILGVSQMLFGVMLSLLNDIYFKNTMGIIFGFLPRLIFLVNTFGYMCFLIIYKWCQDWSERTDAAPNLIQTMIGMFLSPTSLKGTELYPNQMLVQQVLLAIAVLCVPVMLFGEPCLTNLKWHRVYGHRVKASVSDQEPDSDDSEGLLANDARSSQHEASSAYEEEEEGGGGGHGHGFGPNYSIGDHLIEQSIHTIEFVLGAVSNTASYLRLWALSLAHAQLAKVFWEKMIMEYGIDMGNPIFAFIGFGAWAGVTFAVLLCMDVVECFLHALRLHWVEFQSKFFHADGYAFVPFTTEKTHK